MPIIVVETVHYVDIGLCVCGWRCGTNQKQLTAATNLLSLMRSQRDYFLGQELPFFKPFICTQCAEKGGRKGCHQGISLALKKSHLLHTNCLRDGDQKKKNRELFFFTDFWLITMVSASGELFSPPPLQTDEVLYSLATNCLQI